MNMKHFVKQKQIDGKIDAVKDWLTYLERNAHEERFEIEKFEIIVHCKKSNLSHL